MTGATSCPARLIVRSIRGNVSEAIKLVADLARQYWDKPVGGLLTGVAAAILLHLVLPDAKGALAFVVPLAGFVAACGYWLIEHRVQKTKKGRIGIVVAVEAETEEERIRIQSDFIRQVRSILDAQDEVAKFDFIELPQHLVSKIKDTDSARKYVRKCRAQLLVFGAAAIRQVHGQDWHVLRLRQLVVHRAIKREISDAFSREMAQVFPDKINVGRENDLIGLQITSEWLSEAAKYFLAVAAMFSGDVGTAETFLEALHKSKRLARIKGIPGVAQLRSLVPQRLAEVYDVKSRLAFMRWRQTHALEQLELADSYAEKLRALVGYSYPYYLGKAIWLFVHEHDINGALEQIRKCRGQTDATWRYSEAFLRAYQGDLDATTRVYMKAFTRPINEKTIFEVEEFITWILAQEPDKYQLYFCLGLLNYKAKGDRQIALVDFQEFLNRAPRDEHHRRAIELANSYIAEMENERDEAA